MKAGDIFGFVMLSLLAVFVSGALALDYSALDAERAPCLAMHDVGARDPVRLERCVVDLRAARRRSDVVHRARVHVYGDPGLDPVDWVTSDPDVLEAIARLPSDEDERRRYVERHSAELVYFDDVTVRWTIDRAELQDPSGFPVWLRVFLGSLSLFLLVGLLVLVIRCRRWKLIGDPTRRWFPSKD